MLQFATKKSTLCISYIIYNIMPVAHAVRLSSKVVSSAKKYGKVHNRTLPKQIEYWTSIGQLVEENPDIPFSLLQETLIALEEVKNGETSNYTFG